MSSFFHSVALAPLVGENWGSEPTDVSNPPGPRSISPLQTLFDGLGFILSYLKLARLGSIPRMGLVPEEYYDLGSGPNHSKRTGTTSRWYSNLLGELREARVHSQLREGLTIRCHSTPSLLRRSIPQSGPFGSPKQSTAGLFSSLPGTETI